VIYLALHQHLVQLSGCSCEQYWNGTLLCAAISAKSALSSTIEAVKLKRCYQEYRELDTSESSVSSLLLSAPRRNELMVSSGKSGIIYCLSKKVSFSDLRGGQNQLIVIGYGKRRRLTQRMVKWGD
jgi:hypothetical protein